MNISELKNLKHQYEMGLSYVNNSKNAKNLLSLYIKRIKEIRNKIVIENTKIYCKTKIRKG